MITQKAVVSGQCSVIRDSDQGQGIWELGLESLRRFLGFEMCFAKEMEGGRLKNIRLGSQRFC